MSFDIARLDDVQPRWIGVGLDDMEVQIKHCGPKEQDRFRQRMISQGIMKKEEGAHINSGRFDAFCRAFAEQYVAGWRNVTLNGQEVAFTPEAMGAVLEKWNSVLEAIGAALKEESDFLSPSSNGSGG